MDPREWEKIKQVFTAALGVPGPERDAYLDRACGGAPAIRSAVDELLSAHYEASTHFLEPDSFVFDAPWLFAEGDRVGGRYLVIRAIARGAMGEVYEVLDERLRQRVALKTIRPQLIGDRQTAERFRREVLVTREIAHEGLCRIFDFVEHVVGAGSVLSEGTVVPCLTMQLLEGESLEAWIVRRRPMSTDEAFPIVLQIADALDVLHQRGVIHRDLKPSNVMLVGDGPDRRAVLTDFGLAKPIDESLFETQTARQGGAPFFMAPELFRGERPSRASDLYAFGLLIDEMVTRPRAFSADSLHALLMQKLEAGPVPPRRRVEGLPPVWNETILRCLALDPADRCRSAAEVCAALESRLRFRPWPVRSWRRVALYGATAAAATVMALAASPVGSASRHSVVILPFTNLTGNAELDYLATGTTSELGRRLSRVAGLRVYTPRDPAAPLAPSQRATFSMGGHVQGVGDTLRVTVQLTHTARETLIWAQNFEGTAARALVLEDTLAAESVAALARAAAAERDEGPLQTVASFLRFDGFTPRREDLPPTGTSNNEAFDAYMRGRHLFEDRTLTSALAAIASLRRAIDLDPNFAAAYATLADVHSVLMDVHYAPHDQLLRDAEGYASQAVALDPGLPDAQLALATIRQMQWRWDDSERAYRRAIQLHPGSPRAHRWFGGLLLQFGRFDESLRLYERALELDPYDFPSRSAYGHALFHAGRSADAARHLESLLATRDFLYAHQLLGQVYAHLGSGAVDRDGYLRKALRESALIRPRETDPEHPGGTRVDYADLIGALAHSYQDDPSSAAPYVARLEAGVAAAQASPSLLARVYAVQRRAPEALDALEAAAAQHDRELLYLAVSPHYQHIRHEPRFRALVERMRLTR